LRGFASKVPFALKVGVLPQKSRGSLYRKTQYHLSILQRLFWAVREFQWLCTKTLTFPQSFVQEGILHKKSMVGCFAFSNDLLFSPARPSSHQLASRVRAPIFAAMECIAAPEMGSQKLRVFLPIIDD
jgi:hypothetical protein